MTPFESLIVSLLEAEPGKSMSSGDLRRRVVADLRKAGKSARPAAVAMNITKLAWKKTVIDTYWNNHETYVFLRGRA